MAKISKSSTEKTTAKAKKSVSKRKIASVMVKKPVITEKKIKTPIKI